MIKAMMKKYRVDRRTSKSASQTVFKGKVPAIGHIDTLNNQESAVFGLLKAFTKKYNNDALQFTNQVIGVIQFLDTELIEDAFNLIDVVLWISKDQIDQFINRETVEELSETLLSILEGDDNDPSKYVFSIINTIRNTYQCVIDDKELLQLLDNRLKPCDDKDDT